MTALIGLGIILAATALPIMITIIVVKCQRNGDVIW